MCKSVNIFGLTNVVQGLKEKYKSEEYLIRTSTQYYFFNERAIFSGAVTISRKEHPFLNLVFNVLFLFKSREFEHVFSREGYIKLILILFL